MKTTHDVIIVGAGLIGAALALRLSQETDLTIALVERAPQLSDKPSPNLRVVALGAVASEILDCCGVLQELGPQACHAYNAMHVWDESSSGQLSFSAQEQGLEQLGFMIDSLECTRQLQAKAAHSETIDEYFETQISALSMQHIGAVLSVKAKGSESTQLCADLLIAADGGGSWVRRQAKIFANRLPYEQKGIVARISTSEPHQDTAWQRFLQTGPVAILPLADNQSSIVWSASNQRADELLKLNTADFERALSEALESKLGSVSLLSERVAFPLHSQRAEQYIKRHLALVGDAAHSIHPLAGQGANLGFKDVESLVQTLSSADGGNIGSLDVLKKYQRARKADNEQTDLMMSALHKAYRNNDSAWITARGVGMNLISSSKTLKQLLVRHAIGQ
ncbi:MAG: 2-octaprenylphenol hydroxylase [Cryomorphaceae bacterium]